MAGIPSPRRTEEPHRQYHCSSPEVDNLLREDQAKMLQKLDQIGDILMKLLGRVDEFKGLAVAVAPNAQLSDQAVSILRQFVDSGEALFFYQRFGSREYSIQLPHGEMIGVAEPRFLEDDLNQLVTLGLLTAELTGDNSANYGITRNATRFIAAIDQKQDT
jgi:hypothetical protein